MIRKRRGLLLTVVLITLVSCADRGITVEVGHTEITKWQDEKQAAVSITYDDGVISQFHTAIPLMNELGLPGTFYVPTGKVPGSKYKPQFIGRPVEDIIEETAETPTNEDNFFERASAVRFLGYEGTYPYHTQAGQMYEGGQIGEAYKLMDEVYEKVRSGKFPPKPQDDMNPKDYNVLDEDAPQVSWEELREFADQGHEIGSHTIAHPRLAVLDEKNMLYELEKSKQDILDHLGEEHIFSAECPYGTEDERVMEYALEVYPALRNRMPEPYLEELNRSHDADPGEFGDKEYVQWQRGALSDTPMDLMKDWINTSLLHENIWLVLVFHGVDEVGWEPLTRDELKEYFEYMKENERDLWIATFKDVTKYMRERMAAEVRTDIQKEVIRVELSHTLDKELYELPLTLRTYVPEDWTRVEVVQGEHVEEVYPQKDDKGSYVTYKAVPNRAFVELSQLDPV